MRSWRLIFAASLAWTFFGMQALANCWLLTQTIDLANETFDPDEAATPELYDTLNKAIIALNNDEVLMALKASGQSHTFGTLRNFLTQIKFVTQNPDRDAFQFTDRMNKDFDAVREIVAEACDRSDVEAAQAAAVLASADPTDGEVNLSLATQLSNRTVSEKDQIEALEQSYRSDLLLQLWAVLISAAVVAVALYYGLRFVRIWHRNRRRCKVPAELVYIISTIPGQISVVGRLGCRFEPDPDFDLSGLSDVAAGTFCTLKVADEELSTKLISSIADRTRMLFVTPISRSIVNEITANSLTRCQLDYSALKTSLNHSTAMEPHLTSQPKAG